MAALKLPKAATMATGVAPVVALAAVVATAVELSAATPLTPEVAKVSPFTKPLNKALKAGLAWPYKRDALLAATVSGALLMVSVPLTKLVNW